VNVSHLGAHSQEWLCYWTLSAKCLERLSDKKCAEDKILVTEVGKDPEENRQDDADDKASHYREIEGSVFAVMNDIAGQAA